MHWYIVQVISGHENKVKKNLEHAIQKKGLSEIIPEVLLPDYQVKELKNGKQRLLNKRMWPGYLLIKMKLDDDSWDFVKKVDGVINFLLDGSKPKALSDAEVASMMKERDAKQTGGSHSHSLQVGDLAKIKDGTFASFHGAVTEIDAERGLLKVSVSIFGRDTPVQLELWQVEPYNPEDAS